MLEQWSRNWWLVMLRGLISILFGITALVVPLATFQVLTLFFGAMALVDGAFAIVAAVSNRTTDKNWWVLLLEGLLGIATGAIVALMPGLAMLALLLVIAAWAVVTGILEIVAAVQLRKEIEGEWLLALSGVASILFGILVGLFPQTGAITIAAVIGAYAIVFGILTMILGWRLRKTSPTTPTIGVTS